MSLVFGTFMTFFAFLLFDNITKSSLWCKSRLLWHFWYFPSFCCLYKLVQVQKNSCRFTDGTQREEILKMQTCRHRGFSKTQRRGLRFND